MTIVLFLISLLYAAIMDVRTGEVPNPIWFLGLVATPIGMFRLLMNGIFLLYLFQSVLAFTLVIFCFGIGLLGGADGKAVLVTSLVYPWMEINQITLVYAPILTLTGALLIVGVQCFAITSLNIMKHQQCSSHQKSRFKPRRRRYWFTRRITEDTTEVGGRIWRKVSVPLVLYILITYVVLLFFQTLS